MLHVFLPLSADEEILKLCLLQMRYVPLEMDCVRCSAAFNNQHVSLLELGVDAVMCSSEISDGHLYFTTASVSASSHTAAVFGAQ